MGQVEFICHNGDAPSRTSALVPRARVVAADRARPHRAARGVRGAPRRQLRRTRRPRSEPVLLIVWLAGMAYVLSTATAAHLMDDHDYDGLLVAVWTFLAGGLFGGLALLRARGGSARRGGSRSARRGRTAARATCSRSRRCRRPLARPLAGRARALGRPRSSTGAAPTPGAGDGLRGRRARAARLVGVPARDRRPHRPRLDVGARRWPAALAPAVLVCCGPRLLARARRARPRTPRARSSGIEYVCCSSGKAPLRTSAT